MKQVRANKIRIFPDVEQINILNQRRGASRFCWNWCLAKWKELYDAGEKPTAFKVDGLFRKEKPDWFKEMDSRIIGETVDNLGTAFKNFFAKRTKYPKFKSKSERDTYQTNPQSVKITEKSLKLPKMTPIRMAQELYHVGKIVGKVTISCKTGRWYVSIPCEIEVEEPVKTCQNPVGIDLGITHFAALSDGSKIENPRHYRNAERRLAIRQRRMSRKVKGSNNYNDAKFDVQRTHAQIYNKRTGFLHRTSREIANTFDTVCIEDLNVEGMKRGNLAKSVSDVGFAEFRRQLEYKANNLQVIDRWYPSSKTCSACGHTLEKLPRSVKEWECPSCKSIHDRDLNAAMNILRVGLGGVWEGFGRGLGGV